MSMNNCPNCNTPVGAPEWKARKTYLWANQWGDKIRIFCDVCGQWSDVTYTDKLLGEIVEVRKQPTAREPEAVSESVRGSGVR